MAYAPEETIPWWKLWQRSYTSNGFPLADLGTFCNAAPLRYARVMYSTGHGLAPWDPLSATTTQSWARNGVMIGDVGYLDKSEGSFQHLFNVFHDEKGSDDSVVRIPDNFVPITPPFEDWEVRVTQDYFPKGAVVTSAGIETTESDKEALSFTFSCPVTEGGILVLPKGGSREELVDADKLYDYIAQYALEWFQFSDGYNNNVPAVSTPNGTICLVTGVDKVPEWSVLSFWRKDQADRSIEELSIGYRYGESDPWVLPESESYRLLSNHCSEEEHQGQLASAFIRGLWIGVSPTTWERYLPTKISEAIYNVPTGSLQQTEEVSPTTFVKSLRKIHPEIPQQVVFYPSIVIIQIMLSKIPKKDWPRLVVVDDALWYPFTKGKYLNWNLTVDLVAHVFKMNKIVTREGVMYLAPKGSSGSIEQAGSILQRLLSFTGDDLHRRAEIYLATRAVRNAVKLVVYERKDAK